jgi:hypothetical protein
MIGGSSEAQKEGIFGAGVKGCPILAKGQTFITKEGFVDISYFWGKKPTDEPKDLTSPSLCKAQSPS